MKYPTKRNAPRRPARRRVFVRVSDERTPKATRWRLQQAVIRAGGFIASRGLTDRAVRNGRGHTFYVREPYVRRFLRDVAPLVDRGQVKAFLDGRVVIVRR